MPLLIDDLKLTAPAPESVHTATAQTIGAPGLQLYWYWIVVHFPIGSTYSGPFPLRDAPDVLSPTNYALIAWVAAPGAVSYDVLRTSTPQLPKSAGPWALVTGLTQTSWFDQGQPLSNFDPTTITEALGPASCHIYLNNRDYTIPTLEMPCGQIKVSAIQFPDGSSMNTAGGGGGGNVPSTRMINTGPGLTGGGDLSQDRTISGVVFGASGSAHAIGMVPDPGATAGATRYLREDGTWAVPPGGSGGANPPGGTTGSIQVNSSGVFAGFSNFVYVGGSVGIGVASPSATLDVRAATASLNLQSTTSGNSVSQTFFQGLSGLTVGVESNTGGAIITGSLGNAGIISAAGNLQLAAGNVIGITISPLGRVGVANASPLYPLDATGDINTSTMYRVAGQPLAAANVVNAVSTAGSYADPAWITSLSWGKISGAPVTVTSFNTRTGGVIPMAGDYTAAMVMNAVDQTVGYADPSWITSLSWSKIIGAPPAGVTSFNTRIGAVTLTTADVSGASGVVTTGSYADPSWITSLSWAKITGVPASQWSTSATGIYYSAGSVAVNNSGSIQANYRFEVCQGSVQSPAIHVCYGATDNGGYITVNSSNNVNFSCNATLIGGTWTAKGAAASNLFLQPGTFQLQLASGQVAGNPLTGWTTMIFGNTGGIGINTSTPQTKLTVTGASGAYSGAGTDGIVQVTTGTGASTDNKLEFGVVDGSYGWIQAIKPGTTTLNLSLSPSGSGNVGVWTTTPGAGFEVNGFTRITNNAGTPTAGAGLNLFYNSSSSLARIHAYDYTGAAYKNLYLDGLTIGLNSASAGNVGIGTTTPGSLLALDGAAAYALSFSASGVGKAYLAMAFSANQWTPGAISGDFVIRTASSQNILFSTTAGSTTAAIINSSGNVGIGTTSPQCILETTGLIRIDGLGAVPTTGAGVEIYYSGGGVLQAYNRTGGAVSQMSIYGSPLQLNSVAGTIVGIANPPTMQDALEVNGNVRVQNYNATENSGKGMSIGFNPTNNNGFFIAYNYATPATLPIRIDANPLIINGSSGLFVGINQNSPSQPLMVATAYCTGTTWTNSSDAALKHNFTDVDGDLLLSRLGSLPVREWSYISEGEVRRMGPTAQDFLAAFHLGDDPLAISTVDGIGVALLACKRLLERLELLERKLVQ